MTKTLELQTENLTISIEHIKDDRYLIKIKQHVNSDVNEIKKIPVNAQSIQHARDIAIGQAFDYILSIKLFAIRAENEIQELVEQLREEG